MIRRKSGSHIESSWPFGRQGTTHYVQSRKTTEFPNRCEWYMRAAPFEKVRKKKTKKKHKHQSCARNHKQHFHTLPLCVDILGLKNLHKKPQQNDVKIFFPPTDRDFQVWTLSLQPSTLVVGSHFQVTTKVNSWKEDGNGKLSRGDLVAAVDTCRSVTSPVVLFVGCQGNEELCVTRFFLALMKRWSRCWGGKHAG